MGQDNGIRTRSRTTSLTRRTVLSGAAADAACRRWPARSSPAEVKVGLIVPLSGIYARPGQVMKMGAEMGIEHINAQGGIKSLGGAKMKLVVIDCGDTTEKAKNAAQRMVAQETDLVAATGAYLSLLHAGGHRGHRARATARADAVLFGPAHRSRLQVHLPDRRDRASRQSELGLPELMKLAEAASGKRPKTVAMLMDNTATSVATAKALKEKLFAQEGLQLVVEEVWTPPLVGRDAADPEGPVGPAGPAAVHAERGLRRQARAGEDQRVRPRPGQDPDHLLQHHHRRAGHAAERQRRGRAGHHDHRRQLGLQGPRGASSPNSRPSTKSRGRRRTSSRPMATCG